LLDGLVLASHLENFAQSAKAKDILNVGFLESFFDLSSATPVS
jgi:hypothetical protein